MAQIRDISKRTALYERLSKDDEQQGESNSILNQKQYLEEYAHKNGFVNIQHFTDDGYTGRNLQHVFWLSSNATSSLHSTHYQ